MCEYYGLTLGVYRFALYMLDTPKLASTGEESWGFVSEYHSRLGMEPTEGKTFWIRPRENVHTLSVASYEVILGNCSIAQIGWCTANTNIGGTHRRFLDEYARSVEAEDSGTGNGKNSCALDCDRC